MNFKLNQKVWCIKPLYKDLIVIDNTDEEYVKCKGKDVKTNEEKIFFLSKLLLKTKPLQEYENKPKLNKKEEMYNFFTVTKNMSTKVFYLYKDYIEGQLNLKPIYQREFVWTLKQKRAYLENLFLNKAKITPTIIFNKTNKNWCKKTNLMEYEVLDGLQRITTLFDFINNKFSLTNKLFFKDLTPEDCLFLLEHKVLYTRIEKSNWNEQDGNLTLEEKIKCFLDINELGTKVNKKHFEKIKLIGVKK